MKDERAFNRYWVPFVALVGTAMLRNNPAAMSGTNPAAHAHELKLLVFFLLYVTAHMQPRSNTAPAAKPDSVMQVLFMVDRIHKAVGLSLVSFKQLARMRDMLRRRFVRRHGEEALKKKQKAPILYPLLCRLLAVSSFVVNSTTTWSATSLGGISMVAIICLLYSTGFRKAEVVSDPEGYRPLSFGSLRWHLRGRWYAEPPLDLLRSLTPLDYVQITPNQSKCDFTAEVWGNKPIFLWYDHLPGNACAALAKLEVAAVVRGEHNRNNTPLFIDDSRAGVTSSKATRLLFLMLLAAGVTRKVAGFFSWHSFRISLATRLHRSRARPAEI
jgi:hypothetical protein